MFRDWFDGWVMRAPSRCEVCHAWPARAVCDACVQRFAQPVARCGRCALRLAPGVAECSACRREPPAFDACHAAVDYDYPWDGLVRRFKFHGQADLARMLALVLRSAPWVEPALEAADAVLPMPLAPARLAGRGFNQALELARRLAPDKLQARLLLRTRDTPAQAQLDREERLHNLRGAFAVDPRQAGRVQGRHLVLVDDVMTSGASAQAAALALREAGAGRVTVLVLARTAMP